MVPSTPSVYCRHPGYPSTHWMIPTTLGVLGTSRYEQVLRYKGNKSWLIPYMIRLSKCFVCWEKNIFSRQLFNDLIWNFITKETHTLIHSGCRRSKQRCRFYNPPKTGVSGITAGNYNLALPYLSRCEQSHHPRVAEEGRHYAPSHLGQAPDEAVGRISSQPALRRQRRVWLGVRPLSAAVRIPFRRACKS